MSKTKAESAYLGRVAALGCVLCNGDRTMLRIAKADEMDLLAWTIEALSS